MCVLAPLYYIILLYYCITLYYIHAFVKSHDCVTTPTVCHAHSTHPVQLWLGSLVLVLGVLVDGGISVVGVMAMDVVPGWLAGGAHGLACAVAQGGSSYRHLCVMSMCIIIHSVDGQSSLFSVLV